MVCSAYRSFLSLPFVLPDLSSSLWAQTTMYSKTFTLPLPDHARPSTSTVQDSQSLAFQKDCFLNHSHYAAAPAYEFTSIDVQKSLCPMSSTGDDCAVAISEALQLQSCPTIPGPFPVSDSSPVGYLNGEQDSAQVTLPLGYIAGESGASSIVSPTVNQRWDIQDHAPGHVTNHCATLSFPHTSLPPPYAIRQSSAYPQKNVDISTFGGQDHGSAGPASQVIDSDTPRSGLQSRLSPSVQEVHPSGDLTSDNVPLPLEQIGTGVRTSAQILLSFPKQPIKQTHPQTSFPCTRRTPSQSTSTSYFATDDHISFHPSFLVPNQIPTSQSPQEHIGCSLSLHPPLATPAALPGFHRFRGETNMELHTTGTLDNRAAHIGDGLLPTLPGHSARISGNHATHTLDDDTTEMTSSGVDNYRNFDESKWNSWQAVSVHVPSLPPKRSPSLPRELHLHDHLSSVEDRNLSGPLRHARGCAVAQQQTPRGMRKARVVCDRNVHKPCGWQDGEARKCGIPITYYCADHFAAFHGLENMARDVEIVCRWCLPMEQKKIRRQNMLRHLREVHLCYPRSKNNRR